MVQASYGGISCSAVADEFVRSVNGNASAFNLVTNYL